MSWRRRIGVLTPVVLLVILGVWLVFSHQQAQADQTQQRLSTEVNNNLWSQYGQGQFVSAKLTDAATQTYAVKVIHHNLTQVCTYSLSSRIFSCPASTYGGGPTKE